MAVVSRPPRSWAEREWLSIDYKPKCTGFHPRPIERLAVKRKARSMLDIECNHFLRSTCNAEANKSLGTNTELKHRVSVLSEAPKLQYRLWLEAGKHQSPFPKKADQNYNSNVWRNFRQQYGFNVSSDGQSVSELIAAMYPLDVPPPSQVGDHTFAKYVAESRLIADPHYQALAEARSLADIEEFRRLRARSEARNPPIDQEGNIMPPENFQRYKSRLFPPMNASEMKDRKNADEQPYTTDMFGRRIAARPQAPYLWKLSHKLNSPEYQKIREELKTRKAINSNSSHKRSLLQICPSR